MVTTAFNVQLAELYLDGIVPLILFQLGIYKLISSNINLYIIDYIISTSFSIFASTFKIETRKRFLFYKENRKFIFKLTKIQI